MSHEGHHHHHHEHCGCDHHHHDDECCHHDHCCSGHHHHHPEKYTDQLLALADESWMEVLKEKIKDQIRSTSSQHLDALAKLVAETNHNRWKLQLEGKSNTEDFADKLQKILHKNQ